MNHEQTTIQSSYLLDGDNNGGDHGLTYSVPRAIGLCRISDSLAQTKGGMVYRPVMPRPPHSRLCHAH